MYTWMAGHPGAVVPQPDGVNGAVTVLAGQASHPEVYSLYPSLVTFLAYPVYVPAESDP